MRRKPFTLEDLAYVLYPLVPFRVMCAAARALGRLRLLIRRQESARVRRNLTTAFGGERTEEQLDHLTRRAFEHRELRAMLLTLLPKLSPERRDRLFPIVGLEQLDRALSQGRGAILVASHLNSICNFMLLEILRERGYDLRLTLPVDNDPYPLSAFRKALYERTGGGASFPERTGAFYAQFNLRPIVRALGEGAAVVVVGDGWHSAAFIKLDFLDRRVHFSTGAMSVARHTGAPVVPMFMLGGPPDKLRFAFEEPILAEPDVNAREDVERMVSRYAHRLEHHLRENIPSWQHWFEPETMATMERLPERSLAERYAIAGQSGTPRGS